MYILYNNIFSYNLGISVIKLNSNQVKERDRMTRVPGLQVSEKSLEVSLDQSLWTQPFKKPEQVFLWTWAFISLEWTGVGWLGHVTGVFLTFSKNAQSFPVWLYHFSFLPYMFMSVSSFISLPQLGMASI